MLKRLYTKKSTNLYYLIFSLIIISTIIVFGFFPRMPQPLEYHDFADKRSYWGIPNFYNVISNLASFIVAFMALVYLFTSKFKNYTKSLEKKIYLGFFKAILLTSLGSVYYHWNPNNLTLFWDRLPMIIALMIFQSAIIAERISIKKSKQLLIPLIVLGAFSAIYWRNTEINGVGDLRLYGLLQFFLPINVALMLWKLPSSYTSSSHLWEALAWYAFAHIAAFSDANIYEATNQFVSGHTLKHICFAFATFAVLKYLKRRTVMGFR